VDQYRSIALAIDFGLADIFVSVLAKIYLLSAQVDIGTCNLSIPVLDDEMIFSPAASSEQQRS